MTESLFDEWDVTQVPTPSTSLVPVPAQNANPCVNQFGLGPPGRICGDCVHLHGFKQSATWYKCSQRSWKSKGGKYPGTVYPGGDHRVRWAACAHFEERKEVSDE